MAGNGCHWARPLQGVWLVIIRWCLAGDVHLCQQRGQLMRSGVSHHRCFVMVLSVRMEAAQTRASPSPKGPALVVQGLEVSPTVPYEPVESVRLSGLQEGADFLRPFSISTNLQIAEAECEGGIVIVKHCNNGWVACVHGPTKDAVQTLVRNAIAAESDLLSGSGKHRFLGHGGAVPRAGVQSCHRAHQLILLQASSTMGCFG